MIGGSIPRRAKLSFGGFSFRCLPRTSTSRGLFVRQLALERLAGVRKAKLPIDCVARATQLAVHHTSQVFSRARGVFERGEDLLAADAHSAVEPLDVRSDGESASLSPSASTH